MKRSAPDTSSDDENVCEATASIRPTKRRRVDEILERTLTRGYPSDVYINNKLLQEKQIMDYFSHEVHGLPPIVSQHRSGRCWMFGLMYPIRVAMIRDYELENNFNFSTSLLLFWDKYEKIKTCLKMNVEYSDLSLRSEEVRNARHFGDGGYNDYFYELIKLHGIVPKSAFIESTHSRNTAWLNHELRGLLTNYIYWIRNADTPEQMEELVERGCADTYKLLCYMLGTPPETVTFRHIVKKDKDKDKDKDDDAGDEELEEGEIPRAKHGRSSKRVKSKGSKGSGPKPKEKKLLKEREIHEEELTPMDFYDNYVKQYVDIAVLLNDTHEDQPYGKLYHGDITCRNIYTAPARKYLNLKMKDIKSYICKAIHAGHPVPIVCCFSAGNYYSNGRGMLDTDIYHPELIMESLKCGHDHPKHIQREYKFSWTNHICTVVGYDETRNTWKIANSWGNDRGAGGYWEATDAWVDKFVDKVFVQKSILTARHRKIYRGKKPYYTYGKDDYLH